MNPVVHFDLPYDDKDRAKKFYSEVFGWKIDDYPVGDQVYSMAITQEMKGPEEFAGPGRINGGLVPREGSTQSPILVLKVDNMDEAVQKVKAAGSAIKMGPHPVGDFGLYTHVTDSEGNIIGLWQDVKKPE